MEVAVDKDVVVLRFVEDALSSDQRRALEWLVDDPILEATRVAAGTVHIGVEWWLEAGVAPERAAPLEEQDSWVYRHQNLACLLGYVGQTVYVDATGHLGGPGFVLSLVVNGAKVDPRTESPVAGPGVLLVPAAFRAQRILATTRTPWPKSSQLKTLGDLQQQLGLAARLLNAGPEKLSITYHPHLADVKIRQVSKAALSWAPSRTAEGLFTLELDEITAEGKRVPLQVKDLDREAPLVSASAKEHLILTPGIEAAARHAKGQRNVHRVDVNLTLLSLPEGHSYDEVELSDYSVRVLGFAPISQPEFEGRSSSGVSWYTRDDSVNLFPAGSASQLGFDDNQNDPCEHNDEGPASEGSPSESSMHTGLASGENPAFTERDLGTEGASPLAGSKREAAIIAEATWIEQSIGAPDTSAVPWDVLDSMLVPDIKLQPHQREGVAWLWGHYLAGSKGALLADEMGLGKTLQLACLLALVSRCAEAAERLKPALIVAPVVLLDNWQREFSRYFKAGTVPKSVLVRSDLVRAGGVELLPERACWVIMPYDTLARHQKVLLRFDWSTVVLDESQNIKNPGTYRTAAARGLKRKFGICSTGTPIENRLRDLWTQFDFLSPGKPLGTAAEFCSSFETKNDTVALRRALLFPSSESLVLHREKGQLAQALPPCNTVSHYIAMSAAQVQAESAIVSGQKQALAILGNLQKLYQHPSLLNDADLSSEGAVAQSPKLRKCLELLHEIRCKGEKVIIFVLYTRMQVLLKQAIHREFGLFPIHVVNGDSNQKKKSQGLIDSFGAVDGFNAVVLSPLAAGAGLNITAANHVIHYGRWWNPAREDQATARAHRIGQTKAVSVHHLVLHHPNEPNRGFDVALHKYVEGKRQVAERFLAPTDDPGFDGELLNLVKSEVA